MPDDALLQRYVGQGATYTDTFVAVLPRAVALPAFVQAFYTTWLFRLERAVLTVTLRRRIPDAEVSALAAGADRFAAWRVEDRAERQLLLCDLSGHTRSWLAVYPQEDGTTKLAFGSAVVAAEGQPLGRVVRILMPVHQFYAWALLRLAARRLHNG